MTTFASKHQEDETSLDVSGTCPLPILLFYGDNGVREFWQDASREWLIFRNHDEKCWILQRRDKFQFGYALAEDAARHIGGILLTEFFWQPRGGDFHLVRTSHS
jgi:hypothetical protein